MKLSTITATPEPEATDVPAGHTQMTSIVDSLDRYVVSRFANPTARDAAIPGPTKGMLCYVEAPGGAVPPRLLTWSGTKWEPIDRFMPNGLLTVVELQGNPSAGSEWITMLALNFTLAEARNVRVAFQAATQITVAAGGTYVGTNCTLDGVGIGQVLMINTPTVVNATASGYREWVGPRAAGSHSAVMQFICPGGLTTVFQGPQTTISVLDLGPA